MNNKITIHLASPRGFCAGVDRAIEIVKKTIKKYGDMYGQKIFPLILNKEESTDIDDYHDLFIAGSLLKNNKSKF